MCAESDLDTTEKYFCLHPTIADRSATGARLQRSELSLMLKENKSYSYIPELQKAIIDAKLRDSLPIRRQIPLDEEDPRRTAWSIASDPPLPTKDIKEKKMSKL